jgi:heme-degrading monooxygenase HmoA
MYLTIWEFMVRVGAEHEFEELYGPSGAWVELFRTAASYRGSELLRPLDGSRRYLTIDRWTSRAAYEGFLRTRVEAYQAVDERGATLTEAERELGAFTVAAS